MSTLEIEQAVVEKLRELPAEKQQEVLAFVDTLLKTEDKKSRRNSMGLYANLGITLKEEDLAEVRREMWANFPRDIQLGVQ